MYQLGFDRDAVPSSVATSPSGVSRLCCEDATTCPSARSAGITLLQQELSAQSPWANTMPGLVCVGMISPCIRYGTDSVTLAAKTTWDIARSCDFIHEPPR